jgi:hypothetical protein
MAEQKILISIQVKDKDAKRIIESTSGSVDRLAKAEKELAFQLSDKGKKLAEVNEKTKVAKDLNKDAAQANLGLKKSIDPVLDAKKKLAELQKPEAIELEKINQQLKIQKQLNEAAAKSSLGLADSKNKVKKELTEQERLTEKLNYELSEEAKKLAVLNENLRIAKQRNKEYAQSQVQLTQANDDLGKSVSKGTKGLQQNRAQSGLNNAILIEMGRTASDAQYGFQGMANNIGRLVELGQEFTRTGSGGLKGALSTLGKSIMGTGGILIGVQLLISFLPTLQKKFKEWRKDTDDLDEATKKLFQSTVQLREEVEKFNENLIDEDKSASKAVETLRTVGKTYQEVGNESGRQLFQLKRRNEATLRQVRILEELGVAVDLTRLKEDDYYNELERKAELIDRQVEAISFLKEEIAIGGLFGDLSPVDIARLNLEEFIKTQELIGVKKEEYVKSLEYKTLVAKIIKAQIESENEVQRMIRQELDGFSFNDLFPQDDEFDPDEIPYFDDMEQAVDDWLLTKGKFDLSKMLLGLTPDSREKDLQALEEKFDPILYQTEEYRAAIQAINDKWDAIEVGNKRKVYQQSLNQLSGFLKSAADLNDGNKELARLSIVASSASAAIGIWDTWWNKDKTPAIGKAPLAIAGTAISYAALLASTAAALKSVNTGQPLSDAGAGSTIQAPSFNVVGASQTQQLAETVAGQQAKPIKAFVVGKDISTQQELDRNITNTASFG